MGSIKGNQVGNFLDLYTEHFRSYFESASKGDDNERRLQARLVKEVDSNAASALKGKLYRRYVAERNAFRRDYFERFRDWIQIECFDAIAHNRKAS